LQSFVGRLLHGGAIAPNLAFSVVPEVVNDGDDGQRDCRRGSDRIRWAVARRPHHYSETRNLVLHELNSILGGVASFGAVLTRRHM